MKIVTSIAQSPPATIEPIPNYIKLFHIKLRRARWFDYVRRRFDMVAFRDIADWYAIEPGSLNQNEERRMQAYKELLAAIRRGEFGKGDWPSVANMPRDVPIHSGFCLRLSRGQIGLLTNGYHDPGPAAHLWAPRNLCLRWFQTRKLPLPDWLVRELPARKERTAKKPSQDEVTKWMCKYFADACEQKLPPPKRSDDAFPACRKTIGATDKQMRTAMQQVPQTHKRSRGNKSGVTNRAR